MTGDKKGILSKITATKKGKLAVIMICAMLGAALLIFGGGDEGRAAEVTSDASASLEQYSEGVEKKIRELCSRVEGVSGVSVAVSFECGFEYVYAKESGDGKYLVVGSGSAESAVRVTEIPPKISGIGIVCKGGGDPRVQSKLISLVSAAFGVGSNKIYVAEAAK